MDQFDKEEYRKQLVYRDKILRTAADDRAFQLELLELCKRDPVFWFNTFCWTFDPRMIDGRYSIQPFVLFPFQRALVRLIYECIHNGEPCMIKKSRDMGVSWIVMLVLQHFWLFCPGADSHVGSRKKEYVDKKGSRSTLFEKFRWNLKYLPVWMIPSLRDDREDTVCKIIHPERSGLPGMGNTITGEASVPDFGISQRYKAVFMDEFAKQPFGKLAYETVSQSTNCIIGVWTPFGKANPAYKLTNDPDNPPTWVNIADYADRVA